jgi:hypothetical protein
MKKADKIKAVEHFVEHFWEHSEDELKIFYTLMKKEALVENMVFMHSGVSSMKKSLDRM